MRFVLIKKYFYIFLFSIRNDAFILSTWAVALPLYFFGILVILLIFFMRLFSVMVFLI